jgi:hypothetical protein
MGSGAFGGHSGGVGGGGGGGGHPYLSSPLVQSIPYQLRQAFAGGGCDRCHVCGGMQGAGSGKRARASRSIILTGRPQEANLSSRVIWPNNFIPTSPSFRWRREEAVDRSLLSALDSSHPIISYQLRQAFAGGGRREAKSGGASKRNIHSDWSTRELMSVEIDGRG